MPETREVIVTRYIFNSYIDAYDITLEALDRAFPEFKVFVNPAYEFAKVVEGHKGNAKIFLGNFSYLFKKVEHHINAGHAPTFPFGQKVSFENFFTKDLSIKKISITLKKKYFDRIDDRRYKFHRALKHAIEKRLKEHCKVKVINRDYMEDCESCKRPMFKEVHHSVCVFDEKNLFEMEILSKTNKFVPIVEKLMKGEEEGLKDVVFEVRVPQMFLKERIK